jgi:hypothetical protein
LYVGFSRAAGVLEVFDRCVINRAPGASGQLRRSDWFLFVCPRTKERKKLTKKERKVCRASDWGKDRSAK